MNRVASMCTGFAQAITDDTAMVSVMGANNEVGTLQPIRELGLNLLERGTLFHTDLAPTMTYGDVDVERDHIHLASLSAHKEYGPKGVGALYIRSRKPRVRIAPILFGGGQERGLRPGTLNTAAIAGMGEALAIGKRTAKNDAARLRNLCNAFRDQLMTQVPEVSLNGHPLERLPGNLSFSIAGVEPLALIRKLRTSISFSASSACATDKIETSHVLIAMLGNTQRARDAFRIAPGRFTTELEMNRALEEIVREVKCPASCHGDIVRSGLRALLEAEMLQRYIFEILLPRLNDRIGPIGVLRHFLIKHQGRLFEDRLFCCERLVASRVVVA